ncbi:MAG: hypothetical protein RR700_08315 [Anaerorhabdus sp.]|uniref:hypothetical protein n=1 Tax=Anaerorhabdus sp. TaxID=1872524 RepID=UPI002FC74C4D
MKKIAILLLSLMITGCTAKSIQPSFDHDVKQTSSSEVYDYLNQSLDSFIFSKSDLPTYKGETVEWGVVSGEGEIIENKLVKKSTAKEYEPIVLEGTVQGETYTFENIMLLDEQTGYLMTYFGGDDKNYENPKLAYTFDGMLWYLINDDKPIFKATTGSKKVRDPSMVRKKDGTFALIATQGWDNPSIYVWDTVDGVTYENERLLQVNKSNDDLKMSEKQAWAPEAFYDRRIDQYIVTWSSPKDGGMFYNYTNDFNDISYPKQLLDTGFTVIDGTIIKEGYNYTIILKDEREPMEEYSQLFLGTSETDYLGFDTFSSKRITGHQSEGPFYLKRDYDYILYYDDYTRKQFQAMTTYDLRSEEFEDVEMIKEVIAPMTSPRHASVIPITWKEWERLTKGFNVEVSE